MSAVDIFLIISTMVGGLALFMFGMNIREEEDGRMTDLSE